jgi:hypothetical protein
MYIWLARTVRPVTILTARWRSAIRYCNSARPYQVINDQRRFLNGAAGFPDVSGIPRDRPAEIRSRAAASLICRERLCLKHRL